MKRKLIRIAIVMSLLTLPLLAWRMYLSHTINEELAAIRAAGLPMNGEELNRWYAAVPDDQNAALVLAQAFDLRRNYLDDRSNLIQNFKLPMRGEPLTHGQSALLQGYLNLNEALLKKANEALKLPASRYPMDCALLMRTPLPHLSWLNDISELHQYSAWLALPSEVAPVLTNITTILALARTLDTEPCLISQFVRLKLLGRAFATLERRSSAGPFSADEISQLAEAFNLTGITNVSAHALIGDRAMTIPYFRMSQAEHARLNPPRDSEESKPESPLPCHGPAILRLIGYYELDYGSFLIGMRRAIELSSNAPPDNLRASVYFARVGEESTKRRRTLSGVIFSSYAGLARRENEGIAQYRLALTALAVEHFRNDNGKLPEELEELVPKYFEAVPEDPFTGWEMEYRRKEEGYVIYSVGPDREDNGGLEISDKKQSEDGRSYDLTFIVER